MGHMSQTMPLVGVIWHPLARLDIISLCTKFDSFSHSWDMDGDPKI